MDDLHTLVGLVGVTLVISVGGWIDDARDWMLGFRVPVNPLRILGTILSSTMAVGFCVGVIGMAYKGPAAAVLYGGLVALAAALADEGLALLHGIVRRTMPNRGQVPMPMPMPQRKKLAPGETPTEEQAHAEMDRLEEQE